MFTNLCNLVVELGLLGRPSSPHSSYSALLTSSFFLILHFSISPKMASYLITGSSRGLGLALITRLTTFPQTEVGTIFATARQDNSSQLKEIAGASSGRVQLVKLDVTDVSSVKQAVGVIERQLQGKGLDYLINNAGVMDRSPEGMEGMYVADDSPKCLL